MQNLLLILFIIFLNQFHFAQKQTISGRVIDIYNDKPLSFANIRVVNSSLGTSANIEGSYELKLSKGNYKLVASFIGYKSDTINISLTNNIDINFKLLKTPIQLDEVTVLPGENPALEVIRKAIETKNKRKEKLNSYEFFAYTKGIIKTTQDISAGSNSVGLNIGEADTAKLKITGIVENESKGYFTKPDFYKEEIIARKQSSNFPSTINLLTGGRIIQSFYRDDIQFFGRPLKSPIADDALDFYYYYIKDTLALDNMNVFQIYFEPDDDYEAGFYGEVFITDSTFNLIKLDINLNDAANPGGIFSKVNVFQQFVPYSNNIYMPIDYRLFVEGNFLGLAKFGFEINTILYDYKINHEIDNDFFDMAILTVMPNADDKDSLYWFDSQKIPNTLDEKTAYERIDSVEAIPKTFWDNFSWLSTRIRVTEYLSTNGTMNLYHFNKVEGSALNFGLYVRDAFDKRFTSNLDLSYGFSDDKFKWALDGKYRLGKYRISSLSLQLYDNLTILFRESDDYSRLLSTLTSLFGHYDFRNYFYSKGFNFEAKSWVFPILELGGSITNRTDKNADVNTEFSFFAKEKLYSPNQQIYEGKIVTLSGSFKLDFRKYIEDGYFRRRTSQGKSYFTLSGEAIISNKSKMTSNLDFQIYKLNLWASLNSFRSTSFRISALSHYSYGPIPFQLMYALPGNITGLGKDFTFRTLTIGKNVGDKALTITSQYSFNDELFKMAKIPLLKDLQLRLDAHFNVVWLTISDDSKELNQNIFPGRMEEFIQPLFELGFGIGHILLPLKLEFTWRLNHREENSFVIAINSVAL